MIKSKQSPWIRGLLVVIMLLLIFSWVLTSFQLAIYGDSDYKFYRREYEKYNVMESLDMDIDGVMEVTEYMMDYLIGKEEVLSIETTVDGSYQDFFNDRDRSHMEDVKNMFLGGLFLRNVLAAICAVVIFALIILGVRSFHIYYQSFVIALGVFAVACMGIGIYCTVDFNGFFTQFHYIFFNGDTWLFDPSVDFMIRMLVEEFFSDFVARIGTFFIAGLFGSWGVMKAADYGLTHRK